ncbi:RNA-directed DNA polymerase from mobile element jockey [Trichonephila clavipes]|nr:RNA-directed DNA polymerase from mobile element jockey [Trichonephila clavipes]
MNTIRKVSTVTQLDFLEKLETRKVRKLVERSNLFEELDDYEFQRRFRLTKESVAKLTLLIEDKLEGKTPCNNALNPVEQVLIALRFYAVAYMQLAIADLFDVSQPTVCRVVHRVSEAIASLLPDFIHLPVNREECKKIYYTTPQIQANIFADFFASKNAYHEPIPLDFFHKEDNNLNKPFHIFEIRRAIKLSKNSTPGADHITASFLKNLDRNGCEIILRYFQDLFDNAIVPNSWKHAVILPIPKQCKDKTRISSYRPIALTSIFSKTFERVLTNRLSYFLTTERKLHPQHYGFVPFKDSRSATYLIHKAIMDAKLRKKYFVGVSLDIKSAYDSVYVDGLLYKCLQIGITGKTAIWIHKFLTYRSFQIKWRGYLSSIRIFPQGLPQGSVLSPILDDFFETLEHDIECSVYADDVFLYCSHHSLDYICKKMQNTLERISQWCKYWKLSLSPDKKLEIAISHQKNSSPGHDKISLQSINHLPIKAINLLLKSFNDSWFSSQIPKDWTHAIILPFIKPHKNPKEVSSYRPISLTSVIAKLLERMILHRMLDFSFQNKIFHVNHHGFYPHRSSINTLLQLQHDIILARERKEYFILVALDIKAAYDSVWPNGLIFKLNKVGYSGRLLRWIQNFLHQRTIQIKWRNIFSKIVTNNYGVPQGCILSPFLFMIYMSDIFEIQHDSHLLVYADDIFLYNSGTNWNKTIGEMQESLNKISVWCKKNGNYPPLQKKQSTHLFQKKKHNTSIT